jgi:hypothetical protein
MKKIITIFILCLVLISVTGCQNQATTNQINSFELMAEMFRKSDLPMFETIAIIDQETAENKLNSGSSMSDNPQEIILDGFVSGVISTPMMMPSTALVAVFEFNKDTDVSEYEDAMKNLMYAAICVIPEEDNVYVVTKDNFLIYVSSMGMEKDEGIDLITTLEGLDLNEKISYDSNSLTDVMMSFYKSNENVENIKEIYTVTNSYYEICGFEENTEFEMDDFKSAYRLASGVNYESEEKTNDYFAYIVEVADIDKIAMIEEQLKKVANDTEKNLFRIKKDAEITTEINGLYIILEAK